MIRLVLGLLAGLAFGYALVVTLNKQSEAPQRRQLSRLLSFQVALPGDAVEEDLYEVTVEL